MSKQKSPAATEESAGLQTSATADYCTVAIVDVAKSKTNPRKYFDQAKLEELAASIRNKGVLVPLLVRPVAAGGYELVAGERRLRAAELAGLEQIPVLVRELSDIEALEVQVIENQQRTDVTPLEEAEGYAALMKRAKYDVATVAGKVGKSASYIYQRLKLADLIEPAKEALASNRLSASHAILIARLNEKDQKRTLDNCFEETRDYRLRGEALMSVETLDKWIHENVHIDLAKAPFKLDDADLLPGAGACTACKFNSACQGDLYADLQGKPQCLMGSCFQKKLNAFTKGLKKEFEQKGENLIEIAAEYLSADEERKTGFVGNNDWRLAKKKCPKPAKGIVRRSGRKDDRELDLGEIVDICTNKKCKECWEQYSNGYSAPRPSKDEMAERKKAAEKQKLRDAVEAAALTQIVDKTKKLGIDELRLLAEHFNENIFCGGNHDAETCAAMGWKTSADQDKFKPQTASEAECLRLILAYVIPYNNAVDRYVKRHKLNLKAIEKQVKADMAGAAVEAAPKDPEVVTGKEMKAAIAKAKGKKPKAKPKTKSKK